MLQNKFEMPLDLAVKPSKIFYFYLIVVFLLAVISILISTSLQISIQFLLFSLLILINFYIIKRQNLNHVTHLKLNNADEWKIEINNKQQYEAELTGECIVTYFLIWLNFSVCSDEGKKKIFHVLLLPDSAERDFLRQLRVRLRFLKKLTTEDAEVHIRAGRP